MSAIKIVAILLIVAGIAGLVYGKLPYTKTTTEGSGTLFTQSVTETARENKTVAIPLWTGIAAIVAGALLLAVPKRS
jgi:multidrug transporter EmrE-like cation transporter